MRSCCGSNDASYDIPAPILELYKKVITFRAHSREQKGFLLWIEWIQKSFVF